MNSPELTVILINLAFILPAYFLSLPKVRRFLMAKKIAIYDLCITVIVLVIAYLLFFG